MDVSKVTIIGLGLIGGSLARALTVKAGITEIAAVSRNHCALSQAKNERMITRGFTCLDNYILDSDIIFLCAPLKASLNYLDALSGRLSPDCLVTDVCSTKGQISSYIKSMDSPPRFIGGHPMAGSEKTGYASSVAHLFENAYYILTPCSTTLDPDIPVMQDLVRAIGGIPVVLDATTHDRITAAISHVPHVAASALVNMVSNCKEKDTMRVLAAGGFRDITRIASSSPEMWEDIISSNSNLVVEILNTYEKILAGVRKSISSGSSTEIISFFSQARDFRESFKEGSRGLIEPLYDIIVDVPDIPGIIGKIATILGNSSINIKNINVSNSREFEDGCLRISLSDRKSMLDACSMLESKGYSVKSDL